RRAARPQRPRRETPNPSERPKPAQSSHHTPDYTVLRAPRECTTAACCFARPASKIMKASTSDQLDFQTRGVLVSCKHSTEQAAAAVLRLPPRGNQQAPVSPVFSRGLWLLALIVI